MGSERLKTNGFQLVPKVLPVSPMNVLLLRYVPKIDSPTAQPGSERPAAMNPSGLRLRRTNQQPSPTTPAR